MTGLLKKKGRLLIEPIAKMLIKLGLTATALTLLGFAAAAIAGLLFALGHVRLAAIAVLVSGLLDSADGTVARLSSRVTRAGAFTDSAVDRYCEAVIFFGLLIHYLRRDVFSLVLLTFVAMSGAFMVSYMRARLEGLGKECRVGLLEREDRVIVLAVGGLVGEIGIQVALWVLAVFSHYTALQRVRYATRSLGDSEPLATDSSGKDDSIRD
ncbi:MAG: CDP-alcohol phosphatidyltransferase family protein [Candidatus Eisenbacteria bacterium]|nr:CDP-alcohol phosphatidyltransferase family protein [Candidatus Eisenbacteria bacterium]